MTQPLPFQIALYASSFEDSILIKVGFIRKRKGKWVVLSEKGKTLGTYDTKGEAVKRLKQIEWFKAHPKKKASLESKIKKDTYSSIMRALNASNEKELLNDFQKAFKEAFDQAYLDGDDHPEEIALEKAKKLLNGKKAEFRWMIEKTATAINLGDPDTAARQLADMMRWMMQKISPERRPKAIESMKRKVFYLNEYDLAGKKSPNSASMGQSLTLLKHLLIGHQSQYIRAVLNGIVRYL